MFVKIVLYRSINFNIIASIKGVLINMYMNKKPNRLDYKIFPLLMLFCIVFLIGCSSDNKIAQEENNPTFKTIRLDDNLIENKSSDEEQIENTQIETTQNDNSVQILPEDRSTAKIMITGDNLIHDLLYMSALTPDGVYDFNSYYTEAKTLFDTADIAIGDFEGTMNPDLPLAGYPIFNCPPEMASALGNAGFDMMSMANNHIADSNGPGIISTSQLLRDANVDVFGINLPNEDFIKIKEVNGIKFAFLGYCYGFNGMEATLTEEEQNMLSWIDPDTIESDIQTAKQMADIVLVFPHMGIEYELEPNEEQINLYHNIIDWGADLVIGNHPHVLQPIEMYQNKFILYSLGNFISNQRVETGLDIWTERGIILELNFQENANQKIELANYVLHPTWVSRIENGNYSTEGYALCDYKVLLTENHLDDPYIKEAYDAVISHLEDYVQ